MIMAVACSEDVLENRDDIHYVYPSGHTSSQSIQSATPHDSFPHAIPAIFPSFHHEVDDKQYLLQGQVHPMSPVSDEVEDPTKNSTMSESLPLIKQQTTSVKQRKRRISLTVVLLVLAGVFFMLAIGTSVFALSFKHGGSELVVKGDNVLITCSATWWFLKTMKFYLNNVTIETDSLISGLNGSLQLVMISHEELIDSISSRQWPLDGIENTSSQPTPVSEMGLTGKLFFSNCSVYPNKCVLEQYLYLVDSPSAFISYIFRFSEFVPGKTTIRATVFDSAISFQSYLKESGSLESLPIKNLTADRQEWRFDLTSEEMRRSSYIFIIIELIEGHVSWFTYERDGQENYYKLKERKSVCTLNHNQNQCKVNISPSTQFKNCFVAQFPGKRTPPGEVPSPDDMTYLLYKTVRFIFSGAGIVLGIISVLCVVAAIVLICVSCRKIYKNCKCFL